MKKNILIVLFLAISVAVFSQKKGEKVDPWLDNFDRSPYQQAKDGSILMLIKNTGSDANDCIEKAKQQAVYSIIFSGYTEANNIPAAAAISPNGISLYNEKIDFFKEFFTNTTLYRSYVPKAVLDPQNPVSELDRKTVESFVIVTIEITRLRSDLEKQNIIKSLADFGFTPTVFVVPSDEWMQKKGYVTKKDNQGTIDEIYNYPAAILDASISKALAAIESKYNKPKGPFKICDMKGKLDQIKLEEAKNNARNKAKQESSLDIFARVLAADLWVKVDLDDKPKNNMESQNIVTLTGIDPYTNNKVITGTAVQKTTHGDDSFQLMMNSINGASDELRTLIFGYFQDKVNTGLEGTLTFSLSENADFNFDTPFPSSGENKELNRIIFKIVKKFCNEREETVGTETTRVFSAKIPLFFEEDGEKEKNSFKSFAYKITDEMSKIGFTCTVEPSGLGRVEIMINGKK
ncbi:MAG: hypothetical protein EXR18_00775 [Flavobacteriaceae bacterium]|nr:hypothetical protein [Flavobacteriaceae bacterium]